MTQTLHIIQIVSAIITIILVLIQKSNADMGASLGGDGGSFAHTRRGVEKFFFVLTALMALIFVASSILVVAL